MNITAQQYQEQAIKSMTKGELLLTLFDEVLKNLNFAVRMREENNDQAYDKCLDKCKNIVTYLSAVLDRQYAVSQELYQLYRFINGELIRAQIKRTEGILEPLIPLVADMRATWAEADKLARTKK